MIARKSHPLNTVKGGRNYIAWVMRNHSITPTEDRMQAGWAVLLRCQQLHDESQGTLATYSYKAIRRAAYHEHRRQEVTSKCCLPESFTVDWDGVDSKNDATAVIGEALGALGERERTAVLMHCDDLSLHEIGKHLRVTKERARQIVAKSHHKMRLWIEKNYPSLAGA